MNLKDARENYYYYTEKLSEVCRQLAFAGIALIWILGLGEDVTAKLPQALIFPALVLVISLSLDATHYAVASASWGIYHRLKEHRDGVGPEDDFKAPRWINWASLALFWGKVAALGIAYASLASYLVDRLT